MIYLVVTEHLRNDILDLRAVHRGDGGMSRLVSMLGELVQTTAGKWITHPPTSCPNGHRLGPR